MLKLQSILCIFLCTVFTELAWAVNFKAAVFEYNAPFHIDPVIPEARLMKNIAQYEKYASENPTRFEIIVFPESTLYTGSWFRTASDIFPYSTLVPAPGSSTVACDDDMYTYATFLKKLSCLAKNNRKFVAVNLAENDRCRGSEGCPDVGYHVYNTNVVFDISGRVVARYRKYNLFGEIYMTKPKMERVTFNLKPDLKVGTFTCFDLIFKEPAIDLVRKDKVQAVIFPVMWYSELPFLTALQSQQQWARELNVVLLAAGANNPLFGSGGSGIYNGKLGYNQATITSKAKSTIIYEDITTATSRNITTRSTRDIDDEAKDMDTFTLLQDNLKAYSSQLLDLKERVFQTEVCNGKEPTKLCCHFTVETTIDPDLINDGKNHYQYHLVAFSGVRTFSGVATGGIETCAVIACTNDTVASCGKRFPDYNSISWPLKFSRIQVKAEYIDDENRIQFPNSLLSNIHPLPVAASTWEKKQKGDKVERIHTLIQGQERLLTFGIFGRDFNRDGKDVTQPDPSKPEDDDDDKKGAASITKLHISVMATACLLFLINTFSI